MLIVQDIHIVQGRAELPFEDLYRREVAAGLESCGASLLFFGWNPHGAGEGYEAIVLTAVKDAAGLRTYQEALSDGALSDAWDRIEASDYAHQSSLLETVNLSETAKQPSTQGPRNLFLHETVSLDGDLDDAAEEIPVGVRQEDDALEVVAVLRPALVGLDRQELTILSRFRGSERFRTALDSLTSGYFSGAVTVTGESSRRVRTTRPSAFSSIQ